MIREYFLSITRQLTVAILTRWLGRSGMPISGYEPVAGRLMYVPASCLPYHISGYTTRTHAVIRALRNAGGDVRILTRPGYPWDRSDRRCNAADGHAVVDGIEYLHERYPPNYLPVLAFAFLAAKPIVRMACNERVAAIHAASNHVNALPALIAARKLGIPFHYEMRGLWELTRVSRMPEYEASQGYRQGLALEGLVAKHADRLFVISRQLGNYARETWGIPEERIGLLPNCIDPEEILPADPAQVEPNSIGYAGSLIGYEGLDTLIDAVAALAVRGNPVKVSVIGDGEARQQLETQVQRLGLCDRVRFLGKMPPDSALEILGRCALVCIPRKPYKVCEIVPPIKLVEALALGKPVIVPDLPVFRDEMGDCPPGWFFRAGDASDLACVIEGALEGEDEVRMRGVQAREYATMERRWADFVPRILEP